MGTTTDCVSKDAKAPPAKLDMADAADAVGANLLAGSAAHVLVISRVVKYICNTQEMSQLLMLAGNAD